MPYQKSSSWTALIAAAWIAPACVTGDNEPPVRAEHASAPAPPPAVVGPPLAPVAVMPAAATPDAERILKVIGHADVMSAAAMVLQKNRMVTGGEDHIVRIWDTTGGLSLARLAGHTQAIVAVAMAGDAKVAASFGRDSTLRFWDLEKQAERRVAIGLPKNLVARALAFSADGATLAVGCDDRVVRLITPDTGLVSATLKGHAQAVTALAFLRDGRLVSGDEEGMLVVWDAAKNVELSRFRAAAGAVRSLATHPDGVRLAIGAGDDVVHVFDLVTGTETAKIAVARLEIGPIAFAAGGLQVVVGGTSRLIEADATKESYDVLAFDLASGNMAALHAGHKGPVLSLAAADDGTVVSLSADETLRHWPVTKAQTPMISR